MPHPSLDNLRRAARGEEPPPPSRRHHIISGGFWWSWVAGTFGPLLGGLALQDERTPNTLAAALLALGIGALVVNIVWAITTAGYTRGCTAPVGRAVALGTGYMSMAILALLALAVVLAIVLAVMILIGVFRTLASD